MIKSLDGIISKDKLTALELQTLLNAPDLEITEKIDGSQITWLNTHEELTISSKKLILYPNQTIPKQFQPAVEYLIDNRDKIPTNIQFFAETLSKPRHNALKYERVPQNHLYLFAAKAWPSSVSYSNIYTLDMLASYMNIEPPHVVQSINDSSCLGGTMEGIVYSCYNGENLCKIKEVSEAFKEVKQVLKDRKKAMKGVSTDYWTEFKQRFKTEARWLKAIAHLNEQGLLNHDDSDIGLLFKEVSQDIVKEEQDTMVDFFNKHFRKELLKTACEGIPQFYREYLQNNREFSPATLQLAKANIIAAAAETDEGFLIRAETESKLEGIF